MGQITLRGMDPEIEREIRRIAKEGGKSINRVIQDMIYLHTGMGKKKQRPAADSLRKLAGGWNEEEAEEFLESIRSCEQIDEEMWK